MNTKQKNNMLALTGIAVAVSYWTGYVHGSSNLSRTEVIISVALPAVFLWTLAKLTFAFAFRQPPSGGGSRPPTAPPPLVPAPGPPGAPPVIHCEQAI